MTEVRYYHKGDRFRLRCEGHATGNQDVCAAVSSLVYALAGFLGNRQGGSTVVDRRDLKEGYAEILFTSRDQKVLGAWDMTLFGLKQLENSFGDYIRVKKV